MPPTPSVNTEYLSGHIYYSIYFPLSNRHIQVILPIPELHSRTILASSRNAIEYKSNNIKHSISPACTEKLDLDEKFQISALLKSTYES